MKMKAGTAWPMIIALCLLFLACGSVAASGARDLQSRDADKDGRPSIRLGEPEAASRSGVMASLGKKIRGFLDPEASVDEVLLLSLLALGYGILHALGPGHQKTLVAGYLLSEGGGLGAAVAVGAVASASHAFSVLGLFTLLTLLGSGLAAAEVSKSGEIVAFTSNTLLVVLALVMVRRKIAILFSCVRNAGLKDGENGTDEARPDCCCGGHGNTDRPAAGEARIAARKRISLPLLVSGSLVPCPGAALFLLYGFRRGSPLGGVLAVLAISVGMWLTLTAIGIVTVMLRRVGLGESGTKQPVTGFISAVFGVVGSASVLVLALLTSLPR